MKCDESQPNMIALVDRFQLCELGLYCVSLSFSLKHFSSSGFIVKHLLVMYFACLLKIELPN